MTDVLWRGRFPADFISFVSRGSPPRNFSRKPELVVRAAKIPVLFYIPTTCPMCSCKMKACYLPRIVATLDSSARVKDIGNEMPQLVRRAPRCIGTSVLLEASSGWRSPRPSSRPSDSILRILNSEDAALRRGI